MHVNRKRLFVTGGLLLAVLMGASVCNSGSGLPLPGGLKDSGGFTESEALGMSLEQQFELVSVRDARMYELLADAQQQISDGLWQIGYHGGIPLLGPNRWSVSGMGSSNSYYLSVFSYLTPKGAIGAREDLDPMLAYFQTQGWEVRVEDESEFRHTAYGDTGEGFVVSWSVQPNGQYNLIVDSETFGVIRMSCIRLSGIACHREVLISVNLRFPGCGRSFLALMILRCMRRICSIVHGTPERNSLPRLIDS